MKITSVQPNTSRKDQGIALLFVILLTSVLLLVSIGITNISYRETAFSIEAQDSDRALFAADTGIECGLYLYNKGVFSGTETGTHMCTGLVPTVLGSDPNFSFVLPASTGSCALVTVNKAYGSDSDGDGVGDYTRIASVGYNVPLEPSATACITGTPGLRVVTRALSLQFLNPVPDGGGGGAP